MPVRITFTKEEKEEDYKDVEKMLRNNMSYSEIAHELGRSIQYICDTRAYLAETGILTIEELNAIKEKFKTDEEKKIDKKVLSLLESGYTKNEIHKMLNISPYEVKNSINRLTASGIDITKFKTRKEIEHDARKRKIKKLIKKGYYKEQITNETHIPRTTVNRLIEELIKEKKLKPTDVKFSKDLAEEKLSKRNQEIKKLYEIGLSIKEIAEKINVSETTVFNVIKDKKYEPIYRKRKKVTVKEIDDTLTAYEIEIINYLKKGYSYVTIRKILSIEQTDLMQIVNKLKKERYISQDIINEAITKRKEYYNVTIKKLLKEGYTQADIIRYLNEKVEEVTSAYVSRTVTNLLNSGEITNEIIEEALDNSRSSFKSIDKKVLEYLEQGLNVKEIIEADEDDYLTESRVRRSKKRLIKEGKITEDEITKYRLRKEQYEKEQVYKCDEKIIWDYIRKEGLTTSEISEKIGQCTAYIGARLLNIKKRKKINLKDIYRIRKEAKAKILQEEKELLKKEKLKLEKLIDKYNKIKDKVKIFIKEDIDKDKLYDEFVRLFKILINYKDTIFKEDIKLLSEIVLYIEKYSTDIYASYVIDLFFNIGAYRDAEIFLNQYFCDRNKVNELYINTHKKLKSL